ncbi:hypothetical protein HD599_001640 [Conyzicola lurida]|uniref:Uncharacterized protein n=1 Tax=Conyzicola lurida TaxID=1172621 RepID=A0A841AJC2_9MICO|nr:hypothetical protein [Conyzicola lurida]
MSANEDRAVAAAKSRFALLTAPIFGLSYLQIEATVGNLVSSGAANRACR